MFGIFYYIPPTVTTIYTVTGTDGNSCPNTNVIFITVNICTGIANFNSIGTHDFKIYPNPSTGILLPVSNVSGKPEYIALLA